VITNAGALNTEPLSVKVQEMCHEKGHKDLVIAIVLGDDISKTVTDPARCEDLLHLDHPDCKLKDLQLGPCSGVAYIGAWCIVEGIKAGADILWTGDGHIPSDRCCGMVA
jgi:hypothetical protein